MKQYGVTRGPEPEESDREILKQFVETPDPVLFASEIADLFDKTDEWARKRLNALVDEGHLGTKKPGHRTRVYWITPKGHRYYAESSDPSGSQ